MEYKYIFKVKLVNLKNPYNEAVKSVGDAFQQPQRERAYIITTLDNIITTNIEPNNRIISAMEELGCEAFKKLDDTILIDYSFERVECVVDEPQSKLNPQLQRH